MYNLPGVDGFMLMYQRGTAAVINGINVDYIYVKTDDLDIYISAGWVTDPTFLLHE